MSIGLLVECLVRVLSMANAFIFAGIFDRKTLQVST